MAHPPAGTAAADPADLDEVDDPAPGWRGARSLAELCAEAPLPWEQVAGIGASAAAGLSALHAEGQVHGRVRPETVIACPDGRTWLVDPATAVNIPDVRPVRTAPELREGGGPSGAADVFALGVTLLGLLGHHIERQRVTIMDESVAIPEAGAQILLGMLAERPDARLDAATVAGRLEATARRHPSSVPDTPAEAVVVPLFADAVDTADPGALPDEAARPMAIPAVARPLAPSVATPRRLGVLTGATVAALFALLFAFSSPEPDGIAATPVVATGDDGLGSATANP